MFFSLERFSSTATIGLTLPFGLMAERQKRYKTIWEPEGPRSGGPTRGRSTL